MGALLRLPAWEERSQAVRAAEPMASAPLAPTLQSSRDLPRRSGGGRDSSGS